MMYSIRSLRVLAQFGLTVDDVGLGHDLEHRAHLVATMIAERLLPGQVALVTGASGAGKSTVLRALSRTFVRVETPEHVRQLRGRAIDAIHAANAVHLLIAAGLADARLMVTPIAHLSDGERARLAIARAMTRALRSRTNTTLVIDEFASSLDLLTAHALAATLARWVRRSHTVRMVIATNRHELRATLNAELTVDLPPAWAWRPVAA